MGEKGGLASTMKDEILPAYPVGSKMFEILEDKIVSERNYHGVTLYMIEHIDKNSGVKVAFEIYKHPYFRTDFTEIKATEIEKEDGKDN